MRAVVVKQKTVVALWHWSQSLQRKVSQTHTHTHTHTPHCYVTHTIHTGSGVLADVCDESQEEG